jgi:hypothetical protein
VLKARTNISFRSCGKLSTYQPGDVINELHEHIVKTHFSGQVIEERMFKIKSANIYVNTGQKNAIRNALDEVRDLRDSLKSTNELLIDLKNSITEKPAEPIVVSDKLEIITIAVDNVTVPKEDIESTGDFGDDVSKGTSIKHKVSKLKKVRGRVDE